jgi:type I restriction enzyme S subunit
MSSLHDSFLDDLPVGWRFDRFKDVVALRNEKTDEASAEEDYLELEDLESNSGRILSRRNTLEVGSAVTLFKKGDVLFGKLRPYLEKYWEAEFDGKCTGEILAFKPQRIASRFLFYCLGSRWFIERCNALAYGAKMPRVSWPTQLSQFNLPLPPLPEQQRIAAYLDASCVAIDAAVFAKRRQLETLDALRKSIIQAFFADQSGAITERVKDVAAKITSGVTPEGGSAGYLDSGIPLLRSQNVHFDGLRLDDVAYISVDTHAGMSGSQVKPRDVLLNITGASIGRCTFVPDGFGEGNVNQHVCVIRPGPCADYRFLAAFLSSPMGQDQILSTFTGASRQGLSHSDLGLIRIPFPKLSLQREIVGKIEHHDLKQRSLFGCIESQITTLTAYRKSLIHECVTGQRRITEVDVRAIQERAAKLTRESALPSPTV